MEFGPASLVGPVALNGPKPMGGDKCKALSAGGSRPYLNHLNSNKQQKATRRVARGGKGERVDEKLTYFFGSLV